MTSAVEIEKAMNDIWKEVAKHPVDPVIVFNLDDWRQMEAYLRLKIEWKKAEDQ